MAPLPGPPVGWGSTPDPSQVGVPMTVSEKEAATLPEALASEAVKTSKSALKALAQGRQRSVFGRAMLSIIGLVATTVPCGPIMTPTVACAAAAVGAAAAAARVGSIGFHDSIENMVNNRRVVEFWKGDAKNPKGRNYSTMKMACASGMAEIERAVASIVGDSDHSHARFTRNGVPKAGAVSLGGHTDKRMFAVEEGMQHVRTVMADAGANILLELMVVDGNGDPMPQLGIYAAEAMQVPAYHGYTLGPVEMGQENARRRVEITSPVSPLPTRDATRRRPQLRRSAG